MKQTILRIDIHKLSKDDAKDLIDIHLKIMPKDIRELEIIHGFNHGHALSDFFRNKYRNNRIKEIETIWNNGVTIYRLK